MEDITKKKQAYLRSEIIEGGFDPGEFVEYLATQRENGEDVEVWSMQSLEDMVEQFKTHLADSQPVQDNTVALENDETLKTPEKIYETASQLSARAQSFKKSDIHDDSDDEEEKQVLQAEKAFAQKSNGKEGNQLAEEYIRKSMIDTKEAQAATKAVDQMSDNEKQKRELHEKALQDKKSTIVVEFYQGI